MDREKKFRYVWQHDTSKEIKIADYDLSQIRSGEVTNPDFTIRWDLIDEAEFSGLKDKNGKEIYEGDIVQISERKYKIAFNKYTADFVRQTISGCLSYSFNENEAESDFEIIGNIYENPELLA